MRTFHLLTAALAAATLPLGAATACASSTYDILVVGGGTAGLALANRLSASNLTVAVIEAGGRYERVNNVSTIPGLSFAYFNTSTASPVSPLDWGFTTAPQPALGGKRYLYSRGRMLGGCSAENAMIYQRGSRASYDQWASAVNDSSYSWQALLPFFQRSVNFTLDNAARRANSSVPAPDAASYVPSGGPLQVSHPSYAMPWGSWVRNAMAELGIPVARDFSSGALLGAQWAPQTIDPTSGERSSSEAAFLADAEGRGNLCVLEGTLVTKVLFEGTRATGVMVQGGRTLAAKKEVVLAAGTFQSPQLLMVSGIGPKAQLENVGVPVLVDRPGVGQNLVDHVFFPVSYPAKIETKQSIYDPAYLARYVDEYTTQRRGILSTSGEDFIGWEKVQDRAQLSAAARRTLAAYPADWPELELIAGTVPNGMLPAKHHDYGQIYVAVVAPSSRGTVTISSPDMAVQPVIDPAWFTNATDMELAVAGFKRARQIFATHALRDVLTGPEAVPGPLTIFDFQIKSFIKQMFLTLWHAAGTCKMGTPSDPMAVVDSKARVLGVSGLRVVDASIMPFLPPGHPQSTVYALAEKIASDILDTHC